MVYQSSESRTPAARAHADRREHRYGGAGRQARHQSCEPAGAGGAPPRRPDEQHEREDQAAGQVLLQPERRGAGETGGEGEAQRPGRRLGADRHQGPQQGQPHERQGQQLALRGHRVDQRAGRQRRRDHRAPAAGRLVGDQGADPGDQQDGRRGRECAQQAQRHRTTEEVGQVDQPDQARRSVDEVQAVDAVAAGIPGPGDQEPAGLIRADRPGQPREPEQEGQGSSERHGPAGVDHSPPAHGGQPVTQW